MAGAATRAAVSGALLGPRLALGALGQRVLPDFSLEELPSGGLVDLGERGRAFVVDVPGPRPYAPVLVLLHGLACTAYLNWFHALVPLSQHYRVVALDQRWHGRGVRTDRFRIEDCADDVAAVLDALGVERAVVAGYSLGGFVAQETWHRHPDRVAGLVLCSTARNGRGTVPERLFFPVLDRLLHTVAPHLAAKVAAHSSALPLVPDIDVSDLARWGLTEVTSTSGWAYPSVVNAVGKYDSSPWIGDVDVPTAVVVTEKDSAIPTRRQHKLAAAVPQARTFSVDSGHAAVVLDATRWLPAFTEACADVVDRAGLAGLVGLAGLAADSFEQRSTAG